jgi:Domain of unknown function (DUF397)
MSAPDPSTTRWRKSSHSSDNANCVEVAFLDGVVAVRDSKHPTDATLTVTPQAWTAFTTAIHNGEFD